MIQFDHATKTYPQGGREVTALEDFSLENYLKANHVWVSKTGMGVGVGVNPDDVQRLGWVDEALRSIGKQRRITVFTRHYQAAMLMAEQNDLIVTIPAKAAKLQAHNQRVVVKQPPFKIPFLRSLTYPTYWYIY